MGFECALAIVVPQPSVGMGDFYPSLEQGDFFDNRVKVNVPGREWRVLRFIDFGRVRQLVKLSSSLSIAERAGANAVERASTCTASFLLEHIYSLERETLQGSIEYLVPFVADHILFGHHLYDNDDFIYAHRFADIFASIGSNDIVTGLWTYNERLFSRYTNGELVAIRNSIFWRYNCSLLKGIPTEAVFVDRHSSLLWDSAYRVSTALSCLLVEGAEAGEELRKDQLSVALVTTWRDTLRTLASCGARVIFLTDSFHTEARATMRSEGRYL